VRNRGSRAESLLAGELRQKADVVRACQYYDIMSVHCQYFEVCSVLAERFLGRPLDYRAFDRSIGIERSALAAKHN